MAGGLIALGHEASMRIVACGGGVGTRLNQGGFTLGELWNCEGAFTHVRLGVMNDRATPGSLGAVAVAVVADLSGAPPKLIAISFDGRRGITVPPEPGIAGAAQGWRPGFGFSDWMALASVPRRDGGPGTLLHVRALVAPGTRMSGPGAGSHDATQANPLAFTGRSYETWFQAGDCVPGDAMPKLPGQQGSGAIYTVQWRTAAAGATLQMVGDSIGQGVGSSNGYANFGLLACAAVSAPSRPVHFLQSAVSGETAANFIAAALHDLRTGPVSIACIQTWSGNDVDPRMRPEAARAAADAAWHRAVEYGQQVRGRGGVPIYMSAVPQPVRCPTPALEAARLTSVSRCHGLAARGEFVLDLNGILGDGASPCDYRAEFMVDHFHPNDAGQRAVCAVLSRQVRAIVGA